MKKILLSMLMIGTAMMFASCTKDGDENSAGGGPASPIQVTLGEITHNSAALSVAAPEEIFYMMTCYSKAEIDEYAQGDVAAIAQMEVQYMINYTNQYNSSTNSDETLTSFWLDDGVYQGNYDFQIPGLRPQTEYVLIYAGVDDNGLSTQVFSTPFTTKEMPAAEEEAFEPAMASFECYGDWYESGSNDSMLYLFKMLPNNQVATICIEYFTDLQTHDGVGTFTADPDYSAAAGTFLPGELIDGELLPTYYLVMDSDAGTAVDYAAITDGSFSVTAGDGGYTVKGSLTADNGKTYTLDYFYTLSEEDGSYYDECGVGIKKLSKQMKSFRGVQKFSSASKMLSKHHFNSKRVRR